MVLRHAKIVYSAAPLYRNTMLSSQGGHSEPKENCTDVFTVFEEYVEMTIKLLNNNNKKITIRQSRQCNWPGSSTTAVKVTRGAVNITSRENSKS